ncbi:MAG: AAA-like domain-containing protein [Chloroflexi bacterium]|nr:AAA-like domain-containing protein [Chloroflexota bacterium]MBP8054791.1 AAA-like domain-containing protein [Chloroflexota bacterium]
MMMRHARYFNTHGPVNPTEHYTVPRNELVTTFVTEIEQGHYFTLYAPRQMGKTTLLRQIAAGLQSREGFLVVTLSFEAFERASLTEFLAGYWFELGEDVLAVVREKQLPQVAEVEALFATPPTHFVALLRGYKTLAQLLASWRIVLIVDEFDATPLEAISPLLQLWRQIYLDSPPPRPLHSVVLVGLQNIARLNLGRSSPFNIARQVRLSEFSLPEIEMLLAQYTADTGQSFTVETISRLFDLTGGHPFLVNRTAAILTEEIVTDRARPIEIADLELAVQQLVRESNYNFETLTRHGREHPETILSILFGEPYSFNLNDPLVNTLHAQGIISRREDDNCQISNPIYRQVLLTALRPSGFGLQGEILSNSYDFRHHITAGGLQMAEILSRFRQFVERRGKEAFKVSPTPQEATGQYLLMAYLEAIVRRLGEGAVLSEVPSGDGRLDLIHIYRGTRYIIETKIWRGPEKFDQGIAQLLHYLQSEGQSTGYYVVFHARPHVYGKLTQDELEFTIVRDNVTLHVYLVRLGELWGE